MQLQSGQDLSSLKAIVKPLRRKRMEATFRLTTPMCIWKKELYITGKSVIIARTSPCTAILLQIVLLPVRRDEY